MYTHTLARKADIV